MTHSPGTSPLTTLYWTLHAVQVRGNAAHADGHLSGVQVLIATAITGVAQALIGGQPLLIVGVAEPIVLIYTFMYQFAKGGQPHLSLPVASTHIPVFS